MKNGNVEITPYESLPICSFSEEVRTIPNTQRKRINTVKPPDILTTFLRKTFTIKTTFISVASVRIITGTLVQTNKTSQLNILSLTGH